MNQKTETANASEIILQLFIQIEQLRPNNSEQTKLSKARQSVLNFLINTGPQTLKQLANNRGVSAATMSKMVASLVTEGLVLSANSKHDRRSKIFIVTRKGMKIMDNEKVSRIESIEAVLENLSYDEKLNLKDSINIIQKIIRMAYISKSDVK